MKTQNRLFTSLIMAGLVLTACTSKTKQLSPNSTSSTFTGSTTASNNQTSTSTTTVTPLSCTAIPSSNNVNSLEIFSLTVNAAGGSQPYQILNPAPGIPSVSFSGSAVIAGGIANNTSSSQAITRTVTVKDNSGAQATCNFSITVRSPSSPVYLGCQITATPSQPKIGESVSFNIQAFNGSSYTFLPLYVDGSSNLYWNSSSGSASATQSFTYLSGGTKVISSGVQSGSNSAACSTSIQVRQPRVVLQASSQNAQDSITLSANMQEFVNAGSVTFSYSFTSSDNRIDIVQNGAGATITRKSTAVDAFTARVNVTISSSTGETASQSIDLSFAAMAPLVCRITRANSIVLANQDTQFQIEGTVGGASEAIEATSIDPGPYGTLVNGYDNSGTNVRFVARFSNTSNAVISAYGRSKRNGRLCNGNGGISHILPVQNMLSGCSTIITPNPATVGQQAIGRVSLPDGVGVGPYRITATATNAIVSPGPDSLSYSINFGGAGTYQVAVNVQDLNNGASVNCSTTVAVNPGFVLRGTPTRKVGIHWEDITGPLSDFDYNDAVFCLNVDNNQAPLYQYGNQVFASGNGSLQVALTRAAACTHNLTFRIRDINGNIRFSNSYSSVYRQDFSLPLYFGDSIEATLDNQTCGGRYYTMNLDQDSTWARVLNGQCVQWGR